MNSVVKWWRLYFAVVWKTVFYGSHNLYLTYRTIRQYLKHLSWFPFSTCHKLWWICNSFVNSTTFNYCLTRRSFEKSKRVMFNPLTDFSLTMYKFPRMAWFSPVTELVKLVYHWFVWQDLFTQDGTSYVLHDLHVQHANEPLGGSSGKDGRNTLFLML